MALRLISFDAAGTLIQVREPVGETYAAFAKRHGALIEPAALKNAFRAAWSRVPPPHWPEGQTSPDDDRSWWLSFAAQVFAASRGQPLADDALEPLFEELYQHYSRAEAWIVFEDVLPALENLSHDHSLCVLSNFDRRLRTILDGHGLSRYFPHILLSSEVGAAKPDKRMFDTALHRHNSTAEESLHVGDDPRCDIEGAAAMGWNTFQVARPDRGMALLVEKVRFQAY